MQHNKGKCQVQNYNTNVETPQNVYLNNEHYKTNEQNIHNSHTGKCSNNSCQEINNVVHNEQEHMNGNNNYYRVSSYENMS